VVRREESQEKGERERPVHGAGSVLLPVSVAPVP
jgi:hypothetical protein